jgi:PIN domain nuclease of toxin-antitoxin system
MKLLLDTQSWLWMQVSPDRLNQKALALVSDPSVYLLLSAASSWEIAIKYALGKLPLPATPSEYVPDRMRTSGVRALPVTHSHALHVAQLPQHHRDPFDRLLIAQAQLDHLTILTADKVFEQYDVPVHWSE